MSAQSELNLPTPPHEPRSLEAGCWEFKITEARSLRPLLLAGYWLGAILLVGDLVFGQALIFSHKSLLKIATVSREDALPNWVASVQLTVCATVAFLISILGKRTGSPKRESRTWLGIALFLFLGAMDMGGGIHQRVGFAMRDFADNHLVGASDRIAPIYHLLANHRWQISMLPFYVGATLFAFDFFRTLEKDQKVFRFLMWSLAAFSTALTLNYIEYRYAAYQSGSLFGMDIEAFRHYLDLGQAAGKLAGGVLLLYFFLLHLHRSFPSIEIRTDGKN